MKIKISKPKQSLYNYSDQSLKKGKVCEIRIIGLEYIVNPTVVLFNFEGGRWVGVEEPEKELADEGREGEEEEVAR